MVDEIVFKLVNNNIHFAMALVIHQPVWTRTCIGDGRLFRGAPVITTPSFAADRIAKLPIPPGLPASHPMAPMRV